MLSSIREALGSGAGKAVPLPEVFPIKAKAAARPSDLAQEFSSGFQKVGGDFAALQSAKDAVDYIEKLLPAQEGASVAVSNRVAELLPGLAARLADLDVKVLPSLRQFARSRADGVSDQPPGSASIYEEYKRALFDACLGVTTADFAIADTGTLVLLSAEQPVISNTKQSKSATGGNKQAGSASRQSNSQLDTEQHRLISLVPPLHVCLLERSKILPDLATLMHTVHTSRYASGPPLAMTFITGPSRTADIELSLTMGVHGPKRVHVLLCESF